MTMSPFLPDSLKSPRIRLNYQKDPHSPPSELPFVIGVLANLTGMPEKPLPEVRHRRFVSVDIDNFDRVLARCSSSLMFSVENKLSDDAGASAIRVHLRFAEFKDFFPESVAAQIHPLKALLTLRTKLDELRTHLQGIEGLDAKLREAVGDTDKRARLRTELDPAWIPRPADPSTEPDRARPSLLAAAPERGVWSRAKEEDEPSLLDELAEGLQAQTYQPKEVARDLLATFVSDVMEGNVSLEQDTDAMLNARIAQIDHLVSLQLTVVFQHPAFQKLESTWRGLRFLMLQTRKAEGVRIRVLNITKKELRMQLQHRSAKDSALGRRVLQCASDAPGKEPIGLLIGDYSFGGDIEDIHLLRDLAKMSAFAHAPFIASAEASLLGLKNFVGLSSDTSTEIGQPEHGELWNSFAQELNRVM